jgi:hypothetical protein
MSNQQEVNNYFELERKKHFEFFIPFYQEKNWQVIEDNINSEKKNDWDVKLEIFAGKYVLVDEKVRIGDYGDLLIEIIQDMKTGKIGWYFSEHDFILYGSWDYIESIYPKSLYLIDAEKLSEYINNLDGFIKTCISKKGWGNTWNIILQWNILINKSITQKLI